MTSKPFKVIIAGGSIAGLSLALMLEKNGIDFLVLEAYPSIAPQVGASIGLLPNGLRILDQLGCYESVIEMAEYPVDKVIFRDSRGRLVRSLENFNQLITGRHGYPIVFFERRMLIQILYDKIQDKSKVLTSQRVQTVYISQSHVTVTTKEGQSYKGDIVVGADGIHSMVRRQMWEEARKTDPSWIDPSEENALPATYACIFGISEGVPGIEKGSLSSVFNEKFSYLIPSGPGAKAYWFLVRNMGKTMYGPDIPRFTKQEEETLVKKHWDDQITPTVRFSDLYKNKTSSVYTSLPEYVYKRWYFQRIMTIGDSCHKFEPLTGQGGNSAIETAAALTNHLTAALRSNPCQSLSTVDISSAFEKVQRQREERTWSLVRAAHARQRLECLETPLLKLIARFVTPYYPLQLITENWIATYSAAVSLDMIPIPRRPREIPFYDELFRVPATRGITGLLLYVGYFLIAFIAFRLLFVATAANGTWALVRQAVRDRSITMGGLEVPLRRVFTGFRSVDRILQSLVTIFLPVVAGPSRPEQALQLLYFLSSMLPLISIFTVEGYRRRNKWTLLSSPSLWAVLYKLRGIGFIAPFYFMASTFITGRISYFSWTTRSLPESTAKAILPAVAAGYILPTMLLFFPIDHAQTRQSVVAVWQPAPVFVVIMTELLSRAIEYIGRGRQAKPDSLAEERTDSDLPYLSVLYTTTCIISACLHMSLIFSCLLSENLSLTRLFFPVDPFAPVASLADGASTFLQNDLLLVTASTFVWCWVSVWDLYRVGISNVSPLSALAGLLAGFAGIGPGATAAAVWLWREQTMSQREFRQCC
ncbi:hypothetical protein BDV34DRAFT_232212 [Aspergillus parasiticus]|uniref:FAD-binding domain-containing protein n=1 Tax=Aspergillus parasiticus TaxID=5067 RepID=A0A5N6D5H6_ASPPA|nr:hypothetical protein BDV34DRAFT_232212 [Aspergillus parasiticus]